MTKSHASHDARVRAQFSPRADAYVTSQVHANGEDLDRIKALAQIARPSRALDLGCGGGHVSYHLAAHADNVIACDLSEAMIDAVRSTASARGLQNVQGIVAPAEKLPFEDGHFDFVACRFTAHHWHEFEAGLREARRVLKSGSPAIFVDVVAPEDALADTHLQAVELLRDPSHVRDYRVSEWLAALGRAGFRVNAARSHRLRMEFTSWIARMAPPEQNVAAIRSLQNSIAAHVADIFDVEADGSFSVDVLTIEVN